MHGTFILDVFRKPNHTNLFFSSPTYGNVNENSVFAKLPSSVGRPSIGRKTTVHQPMDGWQTATLNERAVQPKNKMSPIFFAVSFIRLNFSPNI